MNVITTIPDGCIDAQEVVTFIDKFKNCNKDSHIMDIGMEYIKTGIQLYYRHTYYGFMDYSLKCIINNRKKSKIYDLLTNFILLVLAEANALLQIVMFCRGLSNWYYYKKEILDGI